MWIFSVVCGVSVWNLLKRVWVLKSWVSVFFLCSVVDLFCMLMWFSLVLGCGVFVGSVSVFRSIVVV